MDSQLPGPKTVDFRTDRLQTMNTFRVGLLTPSGTPCSRMRGSSCIASNFQPPKTFVVNSGSKVDEASASSKGFSILEITNKLLPQGVLVQGKGFLKRRCTKATSSHTSILFNSLQYVASRSIQTQHFRLLSRSWAARMHLIHVWLISIFERFHQE